MFIKLIFFVNLVLSTKMNASAEHGKNYYVKKKPRGRFAPRSTHHHDGTAERTYETVNSEAVSFISNHLFSFLRHKHAKFP